MFYIVLCLVIFFLYFVMYFQLGLFLYLKKDVYKLVKEEVLLMVYLFNGGKYVYNDVIVFQQLQKQVEVVIEYVFID